MRKVLIIPYIKKEGEVFYFIGKRPKSLIPKDISSSDLWLFPTGKVEETKKESVQEAALREVSEELGVSDFKNFISNGYSFKWLRCGEKITEYVFALELKDENIEIDSREFADFKILELKEASNLLFFLHHKKFLRKIDSDIKRGNFAKVFVFCGPGGSGKGTVLAEIKKKLNLTRAKTVTTREKGTSESDTGRIFVSEKEFLRMKQNGEFIETNFFKGHFYGSLRESVLSELMRGKSVVIELDLNGVVSIREIYSNTVSIFISVDIETLRKRMLKRGRDESGEIEKRLEISKQELKNAGICDYIIPNEDGMLKKTVFRIIKIIKKEKGIR